MKAVVLEVKNGESAVLLADGTVRKVNKSYNVGETIELSGRIDDSKASASIAKIRSLRGYRYFSIAAALLIAIMGFLGYSRVQCKPCSYVTLDVNPSIEYTLNRKNQVIYVEALNTDAQPIVDKLNTLRKRSDSLSDTLESTIDILTDESYLGKEHDVLLIDIVSDDDKKSDSITKEVNTLLDDNENREVHVVNSTKEERDNARSNDISAGRYSMMMDELSTEGTEVSKESIDTYKKKSVKEMVEKKTESASVPEPSDTPSASPVPTVNPAPTVAPAVSEPALSASADNDVKEEQTTVAPAQTEQQGTRLAPAPLGSSAKQKNSKKKADKEPAPAEEKPAEAAGENTTPAAVATATLDPAITQPPVEETETPAAEDPGYTEGGEQPQDPPSDEGGEEVQPEPETEPEQPAVEPEPEPDPTPDPDYQEVRRYGDTDDRSSDSDDDRAETPFECEE